MRFLHLNLEKSGDYHNEMNFENYQTWLKKIYTKYSAEIVIDNSPYHNV